MTAHRVFLVTSRVPNRGVQAHARVAQTLHARDVALRRGRVTIETGDLRAVATFTLRRHLRCERQRAILETTDLDFPIDRA